MKNVIIEKLSTEEIKKTGISSWPVWTKEKSTFPWHYDTTEQCLILEGEITVTDKSSGETFAIKAGDFVTFKEGLSCVWDVAVPVRKHYNFL